MRGFIEELRYRNVFRVAIAYVVAGWLIAQVADLAADAFNAPDWVMQMLIVLLLVGLPVALFLAWAYELTPEGVKKAKDLPEDMPKDPRSGRFLNRLTIIALIIAVAWLGWDKVQRPAPEPGAATATVTTDKSIAVLPFADFSPDGDQAWFADGLTDEILNSLARTPDLHVASRTSSFAYRGSAEKLSAIAGTLGVAHILEGSVRRAGNQLRVTAQLIRASDDKHLWSETYDGGVDNSIEIQEKIAVSIANALETAMDPAELERMISAGTSSVEAWELYLRGRALLNESEERIENSRSFGALELFDQAIAIDPDFVSAHEQVRDFLLGQLDNTSITYVVSGPTYAERRSRFDAALEATIRLARSDLERLLAEHQKAVIEVRFDEQQRLAERISELDPDNYSAWIRLTRLYQLTGQPEKARAAAERAWQVAEPFNGTQAADVIYQLRRLDPEEAVARIEAMLATSEDNDLGAVFFYQAQRAFLEVGLVDRAAGFIDAYELRSTDTGSRLMMRVRQACAEGRTAEANRLFDEAGLGPTARWLMLKTLGRDDEARELVREFETPEKLFILSGYLDYRTFDPREYPLLWATLQAQGIKRPPARPQVFRCKPDA